MTEDEAKTKWCPFVRQIGTLRNSQSNEVFATGSQNRGHQMGGALHNCMCIGSGCMAWRWNKDFALQEISTGKIQKAPLPASWDGSKHFSIDVPSETEGFCGLAGTT
jgi:hypothetical protein